MIMENSVTLVITSCGRFDLLKKTIDSFHYYNTYPIERYVIIENSGLQGGIEPILDNLGTPPDYVVIYNPKNIGQIASIDRAYQEVESEYIFHLENDWECLAGRFIEKSLDLLKFDDTIVNINNRIRCDDEESSWHPVGELKITENGTEYHEYIPEFHEIWHGWSFNPGLRRKRDYDLIKPYKQHLNEQGVGGVYFSLGYKSACLKEPYFLHIGKGQHTYRRNE